MRAHGVPKFPDPQGDGGLRLSAGPGTGIDPNSAVFKAAEQACKQFRPVPSAAERQRGYQAALKFAACMRAHGIRKFPDPQPNDGGIRIDAHAGSSLDPNSSLFKTAQEACQKYLPGGKGGFDTSNGRH